jgi:hypothetical protein
LFFGVAEQQEACVDEAAPPAADGRLTIKLKAIEARQDAQVRTLLKAGKFALVILGGAHDLRDSIARLSDGECEYVVVTTEAYRPFASTQPFTRWIEVKGQVGERDGNGRRR